MNSIRKWLYKPKREDPSKLVQFYYADEDLNLIATELDSFDGHKDPDRCSALVNQLRLCQDKVLNICNEIMDEAIPTLRANRDYRVKFPDEMLHENLAGQLWFGAECLAAGSNVANREEDSEEIRPLAKAVTKALDDVRNLLRDQCLRNSQIYSDKLKEALEIFDRLFAEFELRYVRIMVPIKSLKECHLQQEIIVLFSETLQRALRMNLVTQDMIDDCDPSLMFTIPRLAIVCGLIIFSDGPLNVDNGCSQMSYLFKPFYHTLYNIRELLWTLSNAELSVLERTLCSTDDFHTVQTGYAIANDYPGHKFQNYVNLFLQNYQNCQQFILDFYGCHVNNSHNNQDLASSSNITETWQTEENTENQNYFITNNSNIMNCNNDDSPLTETFDCSDGKQNLVNSNIPNYSDITFTNTSNNAQHVLDERIENKSNSLSKLENKISNSNIRTDSNFDDKIHSMTNHFSTENNCLNVWCTTDIPSVTEEQLNIERRRSVSSNEMFNECSETSYLNTSSNTEKSAYFDASAQLNKEKCENCKKNDLKRQESNPCSSKVMVTSVSSQTDNSSNVLKCQKLESEDMNDVLGYIEDEAIALALQTAEIASHNEVHSSYRSEKAVHELFVAISEVADQLQTNCASDLRSILKSVFDMNSTHSNAVKDSTINFEETISEEILSNNEEVREDQRTEEIPETSAISISTLEEDRTSIDSAEEAVPGSLLQENENNNLFSDLHNRHAADNSEDPPQWVPDELTNCCMACDAQFTLLRRRHHCRNCGKIFCSRCSSYSTTLPHYGLLKPVRVCHQCFVHQMTPYMVLQRCSPTCPPI